MKLQFQVTSQLIVELVDCRKRDFNHCFMIRIFHFQGSIQDDLLRFQALDTVKKKKAFNTGDDLIRLTAAGDLTQLKYSTCS